jgi:hypothetical protein
MRESSRLRTCGRWMVSNDDHNLDLCCKCGGCGPEYTSSDGPLCKFCAVYTATGKPFSEAPAHLQSMTGHPFVEIQDRLN